MSPASTCFTHSSSTRMMISESSGTATNSPMKPKSWPMMTTPIATAAGCSFTRSAITSGIVMLPSICWIST